MEINQIIDLTPTHLKGSVLDWWDIIF
jgi:hypothetical protein